jgi:beta-mannosidase
VQEKRLQWWDVTLNNRDRYLANYVRLNTALEEIVAREAQGDDSPLCLRAVNDQPATADLTYQLQAVDMSGSVQKRWSGSCVVTPDGAIDVMSFNHDEIPANCFLRFQWSRQPGSTRLPDTGEANSVDAHVGELNDFSTDHRADACADSSAGEGEYWPKPYKDFNLPLPTINVTVEPDSDGSVIVLEADKPAFFVTVELGGRHVWSDNGFTLLPNKPKKLYVQKTLLLSLE